MFIFVLKSICCYSVYLGIIRSFLRLLAVNSEVNKINENIIISIVKIFDTPKRLQVEKQNS